MLTDDDNACWVQLRSLMMTALIEHADAHWGRQRLLNITALTNDDNVNWAQQCSHRTTMSIEHNNAHWVYNRLLSTTTLTEYDTDYWAQQRSVRKITLIEQNYAHLRRQRSGTFTWCPARRCSLRTQILESGPTHPACAMGGAQPPFSTTGTAHPALHLRLLLLRAGDVEVNPGPVC